MTGAAATTEEEQSGGTASCMTTTTIASSTLKTTTSNMEPTTPADDEDENLNLVPQDESKARQQPPAQAQPQQRQGRVRRRPPSWRGVLRKVKSSLPFAQKNKRPKDDPATLADCQPQDHHPQEQQQQSQNQNPEQANTAATLTKIKRLEQQMLQMQTEMDTKDETIASLEARLKKALGQQQKNLESEQQLQQPPSEEAVENDETNLQLSSKPQEQQEQGQSSVATTTALSSPFSDWTSTTSTTPSLPDILTQYADHCTKHNNNVDRICLVARHLHPRMIQQCDYVWTWEASTNQVQEQQIPILNDNDNNNDGALSLERPLVNLLDSNDETLDNNDAQHLAWRSTQGYQDYLALRLFHDGQKSSNNDKDSSQTLQAVISWSTKSILWTKEQRQQFQQSLPALASVVRLGLCHFVLESVTQRLEEQVQDQTQELVATHAQLQGARQQIMRQGQAQIRQFAMMSHEIRTPLNCIVGLSNLILIEQGDHLDPSITEPLEMMASSGDLLLAVVDDVLDYAKLAAGKVDIQYHTSHLWTSVNTVVFAIRTQARYEQGVEIRTNFAPNLPRHVRTDSRRLQQILYNLFSNAIKFGREGKFVDFCVSVVEQEQENDEGGEAPKFLKFSIRDYGQGILPDHLEKIFEPFQVAIRNEKGHGGAGLGMAITQQLVRVLGGKITVESEYGKWCEFQVFLPLILEGIEPQYLKDPIPPPLFQKRGEKQQSLAHLAETSEDPVEPRPLGSPNKKNRYVHIERQLSESDWKALNIEEAMGSAFDDHSSSANSSSSIWESESTSAASGRASLLPPPELVFRTPSFKFKEVTSVIENKQNVPSNDQVPATPPRLHLDPPREKKPAETDTRPKNDSTALEIRPTSPLTSVSQHTPNTLQPTPKTLQPTPSPPLTGSKAALAKNNGDVVVEESLAKLRVLIAEDNMINQKVLIRILKRIGIQQMTAVENGQLAVEASEAKEYDIVLMDYQMPVMDGIEATRIITSRSDSPKVVFVSAHALQEYKDQAREAGSDVFLTKPVRFDQVKKVLVDRVNELDKSN